MQAKLLSDNILIKVEEAQEVKVNGIILSDSAQDNQQLQEGKVLLVGPGKMNSEGKDLPMHLQVGDIVVFEKYTGREIKENNEKYTLVKQESVLMIKL
ncbi:MAG: co-chaperone GroES [bacterium]|nr:co-chaperone GroES [bacterium]